MNQRMTIQYEKKDIPAWIMEQLTMGLLKSFFPVSFSQEGDICYGLYETGGHSALSQFRSMATEEVFHMIMQIIQIVEQNEKHYLFTDRYVIDEHTVWVDRLNGSVGLIYSPNENAMTTVEQVSHLLTYCRAIVPEEGIPYIASIESYLEKGNISYNSFVGKLEILQNEIYVCDIP